MSKKGFPWTQIFLFVLFQFNIFSWHFKDILLNVFLAIAVDNLADAESLTEMENEKLKKKEEAKAKELESLREDESRSSEAGSPVRG